jgi:raffinose/stachyose/melibiose transport system substrate-binding protein
MRQRRMIGVLASAAIAGGLLAGCVPTAETGEPGGGGAGGGGDEGATLNLWYLSDNPTVPDAVERFEEANPGVTVNLTDTVNDQYKTKLRVGLGTPNGPDVFFTWGGASLAENAASGLVVPAGDMVAEKGFDEAFSEAILAQGQVDGEQYALPTAVEASMVWYNTEIFDELGLSAPTTWEEFLEVIQATKDAGYTPIAMANATQWPGSQWWSELVALSCGPEFWATIASEDPAIPFDDECVVAAHEKIVELVEAGTFNDGFNGLDYDSGESRQLFWSERAAMNHMGNWTLGSAAEEAPEMLEKMDFFTVPAWDGAEGSSDMMTGGLAPMYAISSTTEHPEMAKELLSYLVDEQAARDIVGLGRVPVYAGVEIDDPLVQRVADAISEASAIAPWPDQLLEPELSTEMLSQVQSLFGGDATPQEAAEAMQAVHERLQG